MGRVKDRGFDGRRFLFNHPHPDTKTDRREHVTIVELRKRGWTLQGIANCFGVSRHRIHQILKKRRGNSAQ